MNLKTLWQSIFQKKQPNTPPFKLEDGHVVSKSFYKDGVQYYQLHDLFNTFTQRGMDALSVYEQWNMRCDRDFLILHTKAVDDILRDPKKINVIDISELNSKLKERLEWAIPTEEIIWKFMSVAYFDANESPYKYDNKYCDEKIKRWKLNNSIEDFFLSVPLKDLIPCPEYSKTDLEVLLTMVEKIDQKHLGLIIGKLSSNPQNNDLLTKFMSARNMELTHLN